MAEETRTHLARRLTSAQVAMIGLSGALGTGLFLGSSSTILLAGPATVISYALAGALALSIVWALAEVVSAHPVPGGHGAVAASYLGPLGGYVSRWNFAITMLTAVGAEVTATAHYLQHWFPNLSLGMGTVLCSLFIVALNLATVRLYGVSEYWFSMIKVTAICVFIALGASLILFGWPSANPATGFANLTSAGGFAPMGVGGILIAACMAVFSFGGIENVSVGAAESVHPERDIPRAAHTMIWRLLIFYIVAIGVVVTLEPWKVTASSDGSIESSPFVKVLDLVGIPAAGHIMNAILLVAALSAANGCLYSSSRMIHSLALDRQAPRIAAHTSYNGVPRVAVLFATVGMVIASILAIFSPEQAFMYLYGCATVGILVTWVMVMLTHLRFRQLRAAANLPDAPARLWGAPYVNYFVIVCCVVIFVALYWQLPVVWVAGIPYIVVLIASFYVVRSVTDLPAPRDLIAEDVAAVAPPDSVTLTPTGA
ncbi:MAG: amino acid permease [Actinomycetaceae bacterium]|nr:amino acid permease [Actinomycetaceae bacterium]